MTEYKQILQDLKKKIYHPVYLLHGEEPYYIDRVSDYIEQHLLDDGEKAFNQTVLYGRDSNAITLLDTLRRYPIMANYQLVLLKEAQTFKELDKLESYFENPMKSTVFVLCYKYKSLDKRTRAYKLLSKGVVLESKKLYDNQVPAFIEQLAKEMKMSISGEAVQMLAEYLGNDLSKIMNEVEKLGLNLRDVTITPQHIEKYIGISKEYNVFEFTKALVQRDKSKAFRIVKYFERNPKSGEPIMVLGMLYSFFSKALVVQSARRSPYDMMSELQLRKPMADDLKTYQSNYKIQDTVRVLHLLHEYDLKTKGVDFAGSEKTVLLTELAYKILN